MKLHVVLCIVSTHYTIDCMVYIRTLNERNMLQSYPYGIVTFVHRYVNGYVYCV